MKQLIAKLAKWSEDLSPYPVAEGNEEHRIKRRILINIQKNRACAAVILPPADDRGRAPFTNKIHG